MAIPDSHRPHDAKQVQRLLESDTGLGQRDGICTLGWPHDWAPEACELDSVIEEDVTNSDQTHHEALSKMRAHAHQAAGVPSKWDLLRAHADPNHKARQALDLGHGSALKPLTVADATPDSTPAVNIPAGGK